MTTKELAIASSTIWVVLAAILVMFMQAGFAFLEAGLTRMKNVGHIAAKNVLVLAIASLVYYVVGFGIAFGDGGNGLVGRLRLLAVRSTSCLTVGAAPFSWFSAIPAAAGYLFEVVFCAVSLAIVWGAMAERTRLWVYFAFGVAYTLIYSLVSHWIWSPDGWLFALGMQDFAGSTVVHYQGALAGLAGALLLGPRIGKFAADGKPNAIPGHNMAFTTLGVIILWFGWFGFNPGSTLSVDFGGVGFFAYVALNTNLAAAAGVLGAVVTSWLVIKKPDLSMMLNGAIAALVAITAACAFVVPVGRDRDRLRRRRDRRLRRAARRADRDRRPGRRAVGARHGRRLGHALARLLRRAGARGEARDRQGRALLRRRAAPARRPGARPGRRRRVHVRRVVRRPLAVQGHGRDPHRAGGRDGRPRRLRARHVGLSRVLHPGSGRLRHREPRAPRPRARAALGARAGGRRAPRSSRRASRKFEAGRARGRAPPRFSTTPPRRARRRAGGRRDARRDAAELGVRRRPALEQRRSASRRCSEVALEQRAQPLLGGGVECRRARRARRSAAARGAPPDRGRAARRRSCPRPTLRPSSPRTTTVPRGHVLAAVRADALDDRDAPELRTAKRSPARPAQKSSPPVAP